MLMRHKLHQNFQQFNCIEMHCVACDTQYILCFFFLIIGEQCNGIQILFKQTAHCCKHYIATMSHSISSKIKDFLTSLFN